jgi:ligand-binding SRPBCC domain-containing protein
VCDVISFRLETRMDAPIEVVFGLARDVGFHARSMTASRERAVAGRTSGPIALGETVTWRARHFGLWWTLQSRITAMTPPTGFSDEQVRGPFAWFRHEHRFETSGSGTVMVDRWSHASPLGPLGWLADRVVVGRYMRGLLETRNAALKVEAERVAASQAAPTAASAAWTAMNSGSSGSTSTSQEAIRSVPDGAPNS